MEIGNNEENCYKERLKGRRYRSSRMGKVKERSNRTLLVSLTGGNRKMENESKTVKEKNNKWRKTSAWGIAVQKV